MIVPVISVRGQTDHCADGWALATQTQKSGGIVNQSNIVILKKTRSICLLYGIVSLVAGLINFSVLNEHGLGMIMVTVAVLGFWRISHKVKLIMKTEGAQ